MDMELNNTIVNHSILEHKEQNRFLESMLGKTINGAIDVGLRLILPDLIENQVIEIKDTLFHEGLKEGIQKTIDSVLQLGKSAVGIVTGEFENISQVQTAVSKGGIIDGVSKAFDFVLDITSKRGILNKGVTQMIKKGKNVILDNVSKNIENTFNAQLKGIEKIDKYSKNWEQQFREKNFEGMQKEYNKMEEQLKVVIPLENTLKKARQIENLHNLIKNNGQNFNLTQDQLQLSKMLA